MEVFAVSLDTHLHQSKNMPHAVSDIDLLYQDRTISLTLNFSATTAS